jgi:hypothetical protein
LRQPAAVACLVLLATAGCTSSGDSGRHAGPPSSAADTTGVDKPLPVAGAVIQLSCQTSILAEPAPPVDYQLVLPGVAMPVARVLEAHPTGAAEPTNRLFAKWGLVVRAGTALDLQLLPGWEKRARIRWGSSDAPGVAVHAPACQAPSGTGQWLHFAGGTWVTEPACVPLAVQSQGHAIDVPLGIGVRCQPQPSGAPSAASGGG